MSQNDVNSYNLRKPVAEVGDKADAGFDRVESFAAEADILFGTGVVFGTDPEIQVTNPTAAADIFAGVALKTHKEQGIDQSASGGEQYSTGAQYHQGDSVSTLRRGVVWVEVTATVAPNDDAYVDVNTAGEEGKFTNVATDNVTTNGIFRSAADAGELAKLEVNLPA